ncbi:hypothetical protein NSK_005865 [Nannochloropsis salina CCMP1776]|uniref:Uncharacterized protein n=1 Tax=Nannochloropsis salina CCMP1776 TaxID=1027361 RepID=A0A4D9D2I5_9STRA|nr:hypothetical protein NSK_005865 [Nannochloropsis salina CCMP1776]|eukprot:TFJ82858.1 hypothetical protein NSK_005865 [Nannochloropsis salina CCMP1776]
MASQGLGGLGLRSRRRPRRPHPHRFIKPSLSSLPLLLLLTFFPIAPAQAGLLHRAGLAQINAKNPSAFESTRSLKACNVTPSSPSFTSSFPLLPILSVFLLAGPLPRKFARDCQHQGHAACASAKVFIQVRNGRRRGRGQEEEEGKRDVLPGGERREGVHGEREPERSPTNSVLWRMGSDPLALMCHVFVYLRLLLPPSHPIPRSPPT